MRACCGGDKHGSLWWINDALCWSSHFCIMLTSTIYTSWIEALAFQNDTAQMRNRYLFSSAQWQWIGVKTSSWNIEAREDFRRTQKQIKKILFISFHQRGHSLQLSDEIIFWKDRKTSKTPPHMKKIDILLRRRCQYGRRKVRRRETVQWWSKCQWICRF